MSTSLSTCLIPSTLLYGWEFVRRHPGITLVFMGVLGEIILDWTGTAERFKKWKKAFWVCLVIGLAYDFKEASIIDKQAADTSERAAMLESNNVELIDQLIQLQKGNVPRSELFDMQSPKFRDALRNKPRGEVSVLYFPDDDEAEQFAVVIMNNLGMLGWAAEFGPIPPDFVAPIFRSHAEYIRPTLQQRATGNIAPLVMVSRQANEPGTVGFDICTAFASVGFTANPAIDDSLPSNKVVLVVGKNEPRTRVYKAVNPKTQKPWYESP
jgi:hypothetical protein